ncbi:MAG: endolytic transglycosylase MltG [Candidatus Cloacimonetes bacterium]|jgi:UPF0755 protein|nr:endolytic transglycosylase MltG [Candidatus Cloacimonadota bacterium]MDY0298988.1 endolytic transglycosylase MltG [Candidatus Cloacimonadaceae bacterium]MCB5278604.1 endolytic transglycosylase MltG [Candidatus Cloacimonadota bacterium]MCK9331994.1 endolytic transglycosylase MltG [Candidatus Cloacimonadota bacterium]MDD2210353.1 endolytic transglycosylase MltG [Candidatus Cloacimonadota bacterium]
MIKFRYLSILVIILALIGLGFAAHEIFTVQNSLERIVRINPGDNARTIGLKLKKAGIISQVESFRILAKLRRADKSLKAGTYVFGGNSNLWQTVSRLNDGVSENIRIRIPEGFSLYRTLLRIEAGGLADYQSLYAAATDTALVRRLTGLPLKSLEGFLYPETYLFAVPSSPDTILSIMTQEFFRKINRAGIDMQQIDDFYDKLILASIIEKEAGNSSERPIVAGVFERRLRFGMALQSCPTVDYILEKRGIRREVLTNSDTEIVSDYNTYRITGLPPTPISNPQVESILAALNPAQHNYLYFFSDRKGNNVFSKSYEEHLRLQRQMGL